MHLAVCDDNIADRKQTERLLGRQSDRIFKECGERIFVDSYGNVDAFLQHPQMYHGLFIDMVSSPLNGFEVLKKLLEAGIERPIIMCSSTIDYRLLIQEACIDEPNIYFLDKPIKVAEITEMVDKIKNLSGIEEPTIELRTREETIYAKEYDIVLVKRVHNELEVHLEGGRIAMIIADIANFFAECKAVFTHICPVNDNALVNVDHVIKKSFGRVTMDNGVTLPVSLTYRNSVKNTIEKTRDQTN